MITLECKECGKIIRRERRRKGASCPQCELDAMRYGYYRNREQKIKQARLYRQKNREAISLRRRKAYLLKRLEIIERVRGYYLKNREGILKKVARYRQKNIQKILVKNRNRKSLLRSLQKTSDIGNGYLEKILRETKRCPLCHRLIVSRREKHIDHIKPISIGGTHTKKNIRVICKKCNLTRPKDGRDNERKI